MLCHMSAKDEEIQLTAGLISGELSCFHAIYDLYHQAVYANICKYVRRQEVAEDILQEVFLALWVHRHSLDRTRSAGGWLFTVSHNKALHYLREALSEKKFHAMLSSLPEGHDLPSAEGGDEGVHMDILQDAIQILPPAKKEVFRLCRLEGKTYKEAAGLLNISPEVVKESLRSANKLIRKYISTRYPTLPMPILLFLLTRL